MHILIDEYRYVTLCVFAELKVLKGVIFVMSLADEKYQYILDHPGDKAQVIQFFTDEAKNFAYIKKIIDNCRSDEEFECRLPDIIRLANFVRVTKLPLMRKHYGIFQLKQKRFFDRLSKILLIKEQTNKNEEVK